MSLRVFVDAQDFPSHARAARAYTEIFASLPDSLVRCVQDPDQANVSYLHMEPLHMLELLDDIPRLHKTYKIGFCVYEADILPDSHLRALKLLDEVWTASFYNWLTYSKIHKRVRWIPHVLGDAPKSEQTAVEDLRQAFNISAEDFVFLCIGQDLPRKNLRGLQQAFYHVQQREPRARLVIKSNAALTDIFSGNDKRITVCSAHLPAEKIAALYSLCHAYVSASFSEGWGLTLSDAMQYGKLCIATGFSGNLDFMTRANSLFVDYTLKTICAQDLSLEFNTSMSWGYPHQESLEHQMISAIRLVRSGAASDLTDRAAQNIRCFDVRHVRCLVRRRLRRIASLLSNAELP